MKHVDREKVQKLEDIPNIGVAIAEDLRSIGVNEPKDLLGQDAFLLYKELCERTKKQHDPCVLDLFLSAVNCMESGETRPWWDFTAERKRILLL